MSNPIDLHSHSSPKRPVSVFAIADSDSYAKFAATTLDGLDGRFLSDLAVVQSPIAPSAAQLSAALSGTRYESQLQWLLTPLTPRQIKQKLTAVKPDIVLLLCTGPILEVLAEICERLPLRPALISGIPGMALPARFKGLEFRARTHGLIVHSQREATEYQALLNERNVHQRIILSTLPFLPERNNIQQKTTQDDLSNFPISSLIFTPQALVPKSQQQRIHVLKALHDCAVANSHVSVTVKLRALAGEQQTHNEDFPYDLLWQQVCAAESSLTSSAITFATGPLHDFFGPGSAHVTVSSTAALESLALGLPTLIINDFGLNERLLNAVFSQSGCVGSLADVVALDFGVPDQCWLENNYFHLGGSQVPDSLLEFAMMARTGSLPINPPINLKRRKRRLLRNWLRSSLPPWCVRIIQR